MPECKHGESGKPHERRLGETCIRDADESGYCPRHKPKPWWSYATQLEEQGLIDEDEFELSPEEMEERHEEVFDSDARHIENLGYEGGRE